MSVAAVLSPTHTIHACTDAAAGARTLCGLQVDLDADWDVNLDLVDDACNSCFAPPNWAEAAAVRDWPAMAPERPADGPDVTQAL